MGTPNNGNQNQFLNVEPVLPTAHPLEPSLVNKQIVDNHRLDSPGLKKHEQLLTFGIVYSQYEVL
ncbi:hypothetical protein [Moorena sp. SIO3H5]|uniref:hypothetical protein n=1 Tax=Moorena sp. SIO3H5 TaxID=2607834 RepID=UPI0025E58026|nr:hypothetical protein [Moorena sp. SIO3H5]